VKQSGKCAKTEDMMSNYRTKALEAFGEVCMNCAAREDIEVHHINSNRKDNELENLLTLCPDCHDKLHNGWPSNGKLAAIKHKNAVQLPKPVFEKSVRKSEHKDVVPGIVVQQWMEKADKLDEVQQ
jgi:hypothetical protein